MKVVILAGGFGTRISEESKYRPKPMVEIGGKPMLWHIMKVYSSFGFNEFIICAGYKQEYIKDWFANYFLHHSDVTFDFLAGKDGVTIHNNTVEPWKVTVVDTGFSTQTGGRVKRIQNYIGNDRFLLTYGDGIGDVDITSLIKFHESHQKICTISLYNYGQNKGVVETSEDGLVSSFREKSNMDGSLINIGFMVMEPAVFQYIEGDETPLEKAPMKRLSDMYILGIGSVWILYVKRI